MSGSSTRAKVAAFGLVLFSGFCVAFSARSIERVSIEQANVDAKALFASECATCHGKDGQAKTFKAKFNHARNLTDAKWQAEVTDERLYNSIHNGKGKMPAFGKKLSDSQINALVAFVRTLKQ
ncbi:MAG TPA: cytochrome c [Pyrinomonadaceae bacterium]|nr:cytochrome c [Pyrinomonadaceae bacterium]